MDAFPDIDNISSLDSRGQIFFPWHERKLKKFEKKLRFIFWIPHKKGIVTSFFPFFFYFFNFPLTKQSIQESKIWREREMVRLTTGATTKSKAADDDRLNDKSWGMSSWNSVSTPQNLESLLSPNLSPSTILPLRQVTQKQSSGKRKTENKKQLTKNGSLSRARGFGRVFALSWASGGVYICNKFRVRVLGRLPIDHCPQWVRVKSGWYWTRLKLSGTRIPRNLGATRVCWCHQGSDEFEQIFSIIAFEIWLSFLNLNSICVSLKPRFKQFKSDSNLIFL